MITPDEIVMAARPSIVAPTSASTLAHVRKLHWNASRAVPGRCNGLAAVQVSERRARSRKSSSTKATAQPARHFAQHHPATPAYTVAQTWRGRECRRRVESGQAWCDPCGSRCLRVPWRGSVGLTPRDAASRQPMFARAEPDWRAAGDGMKHGRGGVFVALTVTASRRDSPVICPSPVSPKPPHSSIWKDGPEFSRLGEALVVADGGQCGVLAILLDCGFRVDMSMPCAIQSSPSCGRLFLYCDDVTTQATTSDLAPPGRAGRIGEYRSTTRAVGLRAEACSNARCSGANRR